MVGPTATLQSSRFALIAGSLAARSPQELGDLRQIEQNHWELPTKIVAVDINHWRLPMTKITGNCRWQRGSAQSHSNLATNLRTCHHQMVNGRPPPSSSEIILDNGRDFGIRIIRSKDVCIYLRSIWIILLIWRLLWSWFLQVWHLNCPIVGTRIKYKLKMSWKDQLKV